MSSMADLFVHQPRVTFERSKSAGIEVDENSEMWSRQVLSELYRQVPEVADYTPTVSFMKMDAEQGYALGTVILANSTDSALAITRMGNAPRKALIPILIKNHTLSPLDLLMTAKGKMMPLSGARLREALFRPETFEMVTEDYGDSSLWNMLYPPGRSDNTYGAGISQGVDGGTAGAVTLISGPGMKLSSSRRFEMLQDVVGPSLIRNDLEKLVDRLDGDEGLKSAAVTSDVMGHALRLLASFEKRAAAVNPQNMLKVAASQATTHVVQLGYDDNAGLYWSKTASREAFFHAPVTTYSRRDFLKMAGEEVTKKVDTDGTVTIATQPAVDVKVDPGASKWKMIDEPGIYKVKTVDGKEMTGWVLPNLLDTDGTRMPMAVFTNGAAATVQSEIVGAHVAVGVDLPSAPAKGTGLFYVSGQGGVEATVPLVIMGREAAMDGSDHYLVRTMGGESSKVRIVPGLQTMRALKSEIMLPSGARFLPLDQEKMVHLVDTIEGLSKTAAAVRETAVLLMGDGDEYEVRFRNLPKTASMFPSQLTHDDAMFLLCLGGLSAGAAATKLAQAVDQTVKVPGLVDVKLAADLHTEARSKVAKSSESVRALRVDLVKEATVLPDVMTVDSVLSLGFINSENVRMFVSRLPYLEKALSMICELVLASRLGLNEIPDAATSRAARGLDASIQGLRALGMRGMEAAEDKS